MLKYTWTNINITTPEDFHDMLAIFKKIKPEMGGFDTETTGLHIKIDKPFLFQFGFLHPNKQLGWTYALDLDKQPTFARNCIKIWHKYAKQLKYYVAHNTTFDLHMLNNIGLPYTEANLTDTTFWIRYAHDALPPKEGGPPLKLKDYTKRYISPDAKYSEAGVKSECTSIAKGYNTKLKQMLGLTIKEIEALFKDCTFALSDLPEQQRETYLTWKQSLPVYLQARVQSLVQSDMIRYDKLNRETVLKYAHLDVVYVLEILVSLQKTVIARGNLPAIEIEDALILPLVRMESYGFKADKQYLIDCEATMKVYIRERREDLYELAGQRFNLGQHALVKQIITDMGIPVNTTNNEELTKLITDLQRSKEHPKIVEFIEILQELRTLEKWYSAYIIRFLKDLTQTDRLYTTIHQVGTVSGRVTSAFQQFPKDGIKDKAGNALFHPRKMLQTDTAIVYLDYSQIELRFQAFYTILVGSPDLNLCRAYMPYLCHDNTNMFFDYKNLDHIKQAYSKPWYTNETNELWIPTDVHGATTAKATGYIEGTPEFAHARSTIGKRVNFAKNYGAQLGKIKEMFPDKTDEECRRIDTAYYAAFPGIKNYHSYCKNRAFNYSNTENLFGVKYYNVSGHKLKNMLIQGSAAFFLKIKIIEIEKYCQKNNIKSRWQMQIHDELSWEYNPEDPPEVFFKFKEILENWPDTLIPIVADMEVTTTNWAEKKEVTNVKDLQKYISY